MEVLQYDGRKGLGYGTLDNQFHDLRSSGHSFPYLDDDPYEDEDFEDEETEEAIGYKIIQPMKYDPFSDKGRDQFYFSAGASGLVDCFTRPDDVLREIAALGDSMSPIPRLYKNKSSSGIGHSGSSFSPGVNSFKRTGSKRGYFSSPPRLKKQKKLRAEDDPIDNLKDLADKQSLSSGNFSTRKDIFN